MHCVIYYFIVGGSVKYYNMDIEKVYKELDTSSDGITLKEYINRIPKYGLNVLEEKKKTSLFRKFLSQFNDLMIIILIITAVIMFAYGYFYSHEYTDTIVIAVVILINTINIIANITKVIILINIIFEDFNFF